MPTSKSRCALTGLVAIIMLLSLWTWSDLSAPSMPYVRLSSQAGPEAFLEETTRLTSYFVDYPLPASEFGQMGQRVQILQAWLESPNVFSLNNMQAELLSHNTEALALSLFPFLKRPSASNDSAHLHQLRSSIIPGSKGLVIPVGTKNFRFACHLIANLRRALGSTLPIQIAYAGESDLPRDYREYIVSLEPQISTFDVTAVFDDKTLELAKGGWAIKPFALLGSTFERALVLDADAVFLQKPEVVFDDDPRFKSTGTLLFHDRLLWKGAFKNRHKWWEKELAHTNLSSTIRHSKVFIDGYAEEGDSGVVAVDKSRIGVFIGLLHICWQNSATVRRRYTYVKGHGDKESWWFGFELSAVPYSMEKHYGAILGRTVVDSKSEKVCSFDIAHVDHEGKLFWYNGSLLKNKRRNQTEFDVPTVWMLDGKWEKSGNKFLPSCMRGAPIQHISDIEAELLGGIVKAAKSADIELDELFPGIRGSDQTDPILKGKFPNI
ncbi:MAG: hypothetical protein M1825_004764 [Sarcosagium campestre]|nr:MAG: hypothetical protein M1825_004764 [Sarcosagium campestre]